MTNHLKMSEFTTELHICQFMITSYFSDNQCIRHIHVWNMQLIRFLKDWPKWIHTSNIATQVNISLQFVHLLSIVMFSSQPVNNC